MEEQSPTNKYALENLPETFARHADVADAMHKDQVEAFYAVNEGQELPEYLKEGFNIARALCVLSYELHNLKKSLEK